mmetsp:Transcript_17233/g.42255  ORF Transcript_17233/g.42255 Transcript_17233/m.42255 type:complete len:365 (+) Transcript_17233:269-1363(+)
MDVALDPRRTLRLLLRQRVRIVVPFVVHSRGHLLHEIVPVHLARAAEIPLSEGCAQVGTVVGRGHAQGVGHVPHARHIQVRRDGGPGCPVHEGAPELLLLPLGDNQQLIWLVSLLRAEVIEGSVEPLNSLLLSRRRLRGHPVLHSRELQALAASDAQQSVLVVPAAVPVDPAGEVFALEHHGEGLPDFVDAVFGDAHPVNQQVVCCAEAFHGSTQRLAVGLRGRPHARQQSLLVVPTGIALDVLIDVAVEQGRVGLHQFFALALGQMDQTGDQPGVVGAPALDAVSYRRGQPLRRRLHQELHQRLEIAVAEDALAKRRALLGQLLLQALASLGFVCRCQLLELRRCLGRQLPGDRLKIGVGTSK